MSAWLVSSRVSYWVGVLFFCFQSSTRRHGRFRSLGSLFEILAQAKSNAIKIITKKLAPVFGLEYPLDNMRNQSNGAEYWNTGRLECSNTGIKERGSDGVMRNVGKLEDWKAGRLDYWNPTLRPSEGRAPLLECWFPIFQYSNIPIFQRSSLPVFQHPIPSG
jgi:hypothetical protein